jgi:hypothetical protein
VPSGAGLYKVGEKSVASEAQGACPLLALLSLLLEVALVVGLLIEHAESPRRQRPPFDRKGSRYRTPMNNRILTNSVGFQG